MRLKKTAIAAAAAGALMLTAACGGGDDGGDAGGGTGDFKEGGGAGAAQDPNAEGPVEVPEEAADGGTITVMANAAPHTLDPTRAYYTDSTAIMSGLVTRSLTQYKYDEETNDMVLVPDMATDLGQVSEDGLTWTFTIKDGIKYEDGTPVTAEDVAYGIKRAFAIDVLPDGPTYHLDFFKDGNIYKGPFATEADLKKMDGYEESWYSGDDYKGVEAEGNKLTIHLATPFADLPYYASFGVFAAIPQEKDSNPTSYEQHPMATGPYKFADYKPGTSLTLVKNDQWDPATDPGRIQAVDGWEFKFAEDTAKLENTILGDQGTAQTTLTYDNVTPQTYKKISEEAPDNLVQGSSPCTFMWYMDNRVIKDKKVREAVGWAFPYQAYWKASGEIKGVTRQPGTTILPPGTAGRVEYEYPEGQDGQTTDTDKARALLEEADAVGFEIVFPYQTDDPLSVAAKDQVVKSLKEAGFSPKPYATTDTKARDLLNDKNAPINVRSQGWCSDWPTGGSWFPAQWKSSLIDLEGVANPAFYNNPEVDERMKEINAMDPEKAPAAWGELDKKIMTEDYPIVNLGYSGTAMIKGSKIGGMANDSVRGMPTLSLMYILK